MSVDDPMLPNPREVSNTLFADPNSGTLNYVESEDDVNALFNAYGEFILGGFSVRGRNLEEVISFSVPGRIT